MKPQPATRTATLADVPSVGALEARVFGPGRFARTAYRVREDVRGLAFSRFCRVAVHEGRLLAAVRLTEIDVGGISGALLLGPLSVAPEVTGQGFGRRLVGEAIEHAREAGIRLVLLVGDESYYGRFGFAPVPLGVIALPGPVDTRRLLAAELEPNALAAFRGTIAAHRTA